MSKKFIVTLICLILVLISFVLKGENDSLSSAGEMLISAMKDSSVAVQVFNMDRGVFV